MQEHLAVGDLVVARAALGGEGVGASGVRAVVAGLILVPVPALQFHLLVFPALLL